MRTVAEGVWESIGDVLCQRWEVRHQVKVELYWFTGHVHQLFYLHLISDADLKHHAEKYREFGMNFSSFFIARQNTDARYWYSNFVSLSVRPSVTRWYGIVWKQLNISS